MASLDVGGFCSGIKKSNYLPKDFSHTTTITQRMQIPKTPKFSSISLTTHRVSMGWWFLRLSAKILALLRLSANFFQLRLTKKLKINLFCFKKLNID